MSISPVIDAFFDEATFTITYLVSDPANPSGDRRSRARLRPSLGQGFNSSADRVLAKAAERGVQVDWVLETHAHADHLTAAPHIKARTGAKVVIGEHICDVQRSSSRFLTPRT